MASKINLVRVLLLAIILASPLSLLTAQAQSPKLDDPAIEQRITQLLSQMTLEEKIAQTVHFADSSTGPGSPHADYREQTAQGHVGSFENMTGAAETNALQKIAVENSRLHIPLLFALDVIHGYRTIFPVPLAMASTWDPSLVEQASRVAAKEATKEGIRWTFSPMVDIARDARWGRIVEGAGEDPYLGSAMARAYVHGYQGKSLSDPTSIAACVKHFAGYGAAEAGREYNTVDMSDFTLRGVYLPPFKAAVDAGAVSVMSAFNTLNGIPASANPYTLTRTLRREWAFDGFVVTDWAALKELEAQGVALDDSTAAYKAMAAGVDMDMQSNIYLKELPQLIKDGKIPPSALDTSVKRILRVKYALGLFDHPYADEKAAPVTVTPEKRAQAKKVAEESIILLKNQNNALPLHEGMKSVALIGPLADSAVDMLGSWIGKGQASDAVTLRAALTSRMNGKSKLIYASGCDVTGTSENGFKEAVKAAKSADVVVMALGEKADSETGEAASLAHLDNPGSDTQQRLLEAVAQTGKPIVLVLFNGHPLALTKSEPLANAIVEAWYPGVEAGNAVADLLFGDANFSAKLPVSMPRSTGQEPLYYAQNSTGRPALNTDLSHPPANDKEKYVSRYIDEQNTPLYPFGYGLSYTTFSYSQPTISAPSLTMSKLQVRGQATEERVTVGVDVKNTGSTAGADVAQLYIRITGGSTEQPLRLLKGFQRVTLAPGETKHVDFKLGFDELSFVTMRGTSGIEPAHYDMYVGDSSQAENKVAFSVEADPKPEPKPAPKPDGAAAPGTAAPAPGTAPPAPANNNGKPVPLIPLQATPQAAPATPAPATK